MTSHSTSIKTCDIQDLHGQRYQIDHHSLIKAAQRCIQEQFSTAISISSPEVAREQLQVLLGHYEHEVFFALWLNNRHQVIHHGELFHGTVDASAVYPREVLKIALSCNAAAVIFAHNHPSGITEPSQADITITKRLKDALALIDIRVLDHMIIGSDVTSMAEQGLL